MPHASDTAYAAGRKFLISLADGAVAALPRRKQRTALDDVLRLHVLHCAHTATTVAALLREATAGDAAALTRGAIETAYSAAFIGLAPKSRRLHRVERFKAFGTLQTRLLVEWRASLGMRRDPEIDSKVAADFARVLRVFSRIEESSKVGWSGQRITEMVREASAGPPGLGAVVEQLRRAYTVLSFHVHPSPLGMSVAVRGITGKAYTVGVPMTLYLSVLLTVAMYRGATKTRRRWDPAPLADTFLQDIVQHGP